MACSEEIKKARALLNKAEKLVCLEAKISLIEEAKEILDACYEETPTQKEIDIIKNIKRSFVRCLVNQFEKMNFDNPDMFIFYIRTVYLAFCDEYQELLAEDKSFAAKIKWLDDQFSEEIQSLLSLATRQKSKLR